MSLKHHKDQKEIKMLKTFKEMFIISQAFKKSSKIIWTDKNSELSSVSFIRTGSFYQKTPGFLPPHEIKKNGLSP